MSAALCRAIFFDDRSCFEFTHPEYPGERLVACRNPLLAER
jgi:hypothetical protein